MQLESGDVMKVSLSDDVSVQQCRQRPQCTITTVLANVQPIVIKPCPDDAAQNHVKLVPRKAALKRQCLDDKDDDCTPQAVAKYIKLVEVKDRRLPRAGQMTVLANPSAGAATMSVATASMTSVAASAVVVTPDHSDGSSAVGRHQSYDCERECCFCDVRFTSLSSLLEHIRHVHNNRNMFSVPGVRIRTCGYCRRKLKPADELEAHLISNQCGVQSNAYKCRYYDCDANFVSKNKLQWHEFSCQHQPRCVHCMKTFSRELLLKQHMTRSCHAKQVSRADEDDVNTAAASQDSIPITERSERVIIIQPQCEDVSLEPAASDVTSAVGPNLGDINTAESMYCDVTTGNNDVTVSRRDTTDTRDANQYKARFTVPFKCYYCVSAFGRRQQLLEHIAGHFCDDPATQILPDIVGTCEGHTKYQCLFCDEEAFYQRTWLTKHIYSCHLKHMRHHCRLCESPPCLKWRSHKCVATGQTPTWSHRCVRCRWRFTSAQDSARHHKENGKEHLIQCLKCNVRCCSEEEILQHDLKTATHSLAAVPPQALLDKAVCTSADVTSQITTPESTAGVLCNLCSSYFQDKAALLQHMRTHASVTGDDVKGDMNGVVNDDK